MEVLIIDDDSEDCAIFSETLKTILPEVSCVIIESGEDAIKYLRQPVSVPNYIFLDISMSGMDGKETLLKIKGMKTYARTRVIMYSGHDDEHEKAIYRKLGANGYINKTGSMDRLKNEIRTVITL
jgi:DNA-binding response OmpR family regulator